VLQNKIWKKKRGDPLVNLHKTKLSPIKTGVAALKNSFLVGGGLWSHISILMAKGGGGGF